MNGSQMSKWNIHIEHAILQNKRPGIVIEAVFELDRGDSTLISVDMKKHRSYRRDTQPVRPCCGSVFRNPLPNHAGKLIQNAELKGYLVGGAPDIGVAWQFHHKHRKRESPRCFIVNRTY